MEDLISNWTPSFTFLVIKSNWVYLSANQFDQTHKKSNYKHTNEHTVVCLCFPFWSQISIATKKSNYRFLANGNVLWRFNVRLWLTRFLIYKKHWKQNIKSLNAELVKWKVNCNDNHFSKKMLNKTIKYFEKSMK